MLEEPGAGERVLEAGEFNFKGDAVPIKKSYKDPWFLAVQCGDHRKVRQMIPATDINKRNPEDVGNTALMSAACSGWEQIARDLIC